MVDLGEVALGRVETSSMFAEQPRSVDLKPFSSMPDPLDAALRLASLGYWFIDTRGGVAIVGAGTMGGGIAMAFANASIPVVMLDPRMVYSCGYWSGMPRATDLAQAQEAKLDLVCRKIGLKAGDRVLDIGCGWGSFAIYAAQKYGARVVGVTVSKQQAALARERAAGLPIEIRVQDYRDIDDGPYDHVISIGMFEHVGHKNYRTYMEVVKRVLKEDGLFLLHTIGTDTTPKAPDPWFHKYIFPNGILPSPALIGQATDGLFVLEDWHDFGADYDTTLMAWWQNFDRAWPELKEKYGERFYRMWKFYLLSMVGSFRARHTNLWQIVLSPKGVPGGYATVR
jgi:cyclopropane-fatty-acyl-phospholipid synthase